MTATLRDVWPNAQPLKVVETPNSCFIEDEIEQMMQLNMTQGATLWFRLEIYCLPLVDDETYYRTDKYDEMDSPPTTLEFIELPPKEET